MCPCSLSLPSVLVATLWALWCGTLITSSLCSSGWWELKSKYWSAFVGPGGRQTEVEWFDLCLSNTYFLFNEAIYRLKHDCAVGSPGSPIVANLNIKEVERRSLISLTGKAPAQSRYLDDTRDWIPSETTSEQWTATGSSEEVVWVPRTARWRWLKPHHWIIPKNIKQVLLCSCNT